jgi:hypothetical protein
VRLFPLYDMKPVAMEMCRRLPATREAWSETLVIGRSCSEATTREKNLADKSYLLRKSDRQLHANHLPHCVSHSLRAGQSYKAGKLLITGERPADELLF